MSPQLSSKNALVSVKSETSYHSPPSSLSDASQHDTEAARGRRQDRSTTAKAEDDSGEDKEDEGEDAGGKPRKRKRSRKGLEKNFPCPHQGCGKSYSRAEHLYRHQLNRESSSMSLSCPFSNRNVDTPKKIYTCNFPGCERRFVRQDLCTRHRERHTARGSHLQRKENNAHDFDDRNTQATGIDVLRDQSDAKYGASTGPHASATNKPSTATPSFLKAQEMQTIPPQTPLPGRVTESYQPNSNSTSPPGGQLKSPDSLEPVATSEYNPKMSSLQRSNSDDHYYGDAAGGYDSRMLRNSSVSTYDSGHRHSSFGSYKSATPQKGVYPDSRISRPNTHITTNPANYRPSPTSTYNGHSATNLAHPQMQNGLGSAYLPHQNFPSLPPLPPPVMSPMSQLSTQGPPSGAYSTVSTPLTPVDTAPNFELYGGNGFDPSFLDHNGNPYSMPLFGGDGYSRSPFAMADDFTAWLFNEPHQSISSPGGPRHGSMSVGTTAFMDESGSTSRGTYSTTNDSLNGSLVQAIPQQNLMAVTSILDPGLPQSGLSEEKRKDVLDLIELRFTDHAPVKNQKDSFLDGDRDLDGHVLSLRSMQTYIGSYWYHFHPQMPILHKPTFSADKTENVLLLAVIAIGASCLDKMHGPSVTQAGAELSNFLAWHLRGEIFKHEDFLPPAKLWVFQTLLLLEVYEKMYATRVLHERAHIHHGTTLTLMRRGSSLIGRSTLDSPPLVKDDTPGLASSSTQASTSNTPEQWWNHWVTNEATRRVAFAAFIIDSIHATMFGHSATMVAHEMKLQLPCDETLWSATSSAEVGRIENNLQSNGIKPMTFFDGLKNTLKGKPVRTNSFGRTAIMAGLLSVSWHMNQRDVQVHHLGALKALGGKDIWRGPLTKAFDSWKNDFDQSIGKDTAPASAAYPSSRLDEENIFESRTVLHHLAHMAMHVDVVSCQIFAKAGRLLGRTTLPSDYAIAQKRIKENWAPRPSARHATFYALKFLAQVLMPDTANSHRNSAPISMESLSTYSARDDSLLNRPWVLYFAALIVWSYGYALDGPVRSIPNLYTPEQQTYDMRAFLIRVGGIQDPRELELMKDRNACLGMLYVLRTMFQKCRWELLHEAAKLLGNCINMLSERV